MSEVYKIMLGEKEYPAKPITRQNGAKRAIVDLCLNAPTPDRDCELVDFLMALQYILDEYSQREDL